MVDATKPTEDFLNQLEDYFSEHQYFFTRIELKFSKLCLSSNEPFLAWDAIIKENSGVFSDKHIDDFFSELYVWWLIESNLSYKDPEWLIKYWEDSYPQIKMFFDYFCTYARSNFDVKLCENALDYFCHGPPGDKSSRWLYLAKTFFEDIENKAWRKGISALFQWDAIRENSPPYWGDIQGAGGYADYPRFSLETMDPDFLLWLRKWNELNPTDRAGWWDVDDRFYISDIQDF